MKDALGRFWRWARRAPKLGLSKVPTPSRDFAASRLAGLAAWVKRGFGLVTATRLLYVFLLAIALLAVWVWRSGQQSGRANWAQDWVPGIGTSAMTILITVAVVDRILGRRERLQRQRRLRSIVGDGFVNYGIYGAWQTHLNAVAGDYAEGHLNSYQRPRRDTLGLLRDWLDGQAAEDVPLRTVQRLIKSQAIDF